jgi:hypothetical protein
VSPEIFQQRIDVSTAVGPAVRQLEEITAFAAVGEKFIHESAIAPRQSSDASWPDDTL